MAADEFRLLTAYIQLEARGNAILKRHLASVQTRLASITRSAATASAALKTIGVGGRGGASFPQRFARLSTVSNATFDGLNRQIRRTIANQIRLTNAVNQTTAAYRKMKFGGVPVSDGSTARLGPRGIGIGLGLQSLTAVSAIFAARRLGSLVSEAVVVRAKFDEARVAIESFAGVEIGGKLIADLREFSKRAPVNFLTDVIPSAQKLLAAKFEAGEILEFVEILTNISLASPQSNLDKIVFNLSQIKLKQRAATIDLREFANQGIPIYAALEEAINSTRGATAKLTDDELTKFITAGKIGVEEVLDAFRLLSTEAFFGDLIAKNLDSPIAKLAQIKNKMDEIRLTIGDAFVPVLDAIADGLERAFSAENLETMHRTITEFLVPALKDLINTLVTVADLSAKIAAPIFALQDFQDRVTNTLTRPFGLTLRILSPFSNPLSRFPLGFGNDSEDDETRSRPIKKRIFESQGKFILRNQRHAENLELLAKTQASLFLPEEKRIVQLRQALDVAKRFDNEDLFKRVRAGLEDITDPGGKENRSTVLQATEFKSAEFFRQIAAEQFGFGKIDKTLNKGNDIAEEANKLLTELNEAVKGSEVNVRVRVPLLQPF